MLFERLLGQFRDEDEPRLTDPLSMPVENKRMADPPEAVEGLPLDLERCLVIEGIEIEPLEHSPIVLQTPTVRRRRQPMGTDWTQVSPGHTGEMIQAADIAESVRGARDIENQIRVRRENS